MRTFYSVQQKAEAIKAFTDFINQPSTSELREPIKKSLDYTKKQTGVEWASIALWHLQAAYDPHSEVYKAVRELARESDKDLKIRRLSF